MAENRNVVLIHTAFIGDVVLALPLVQTLRRSSPSTRVSFVAVPGSAPVLSNHPGIEKILVFDKRGKEAGLSGLRRMARSLEKNSFDIAIVPHRSLRSALLPRMANIPVRIGFATGIGRFLYSHRVPRNMNDHEIERNLRLLEPLNIEYDPRELPKLYPTEYDVRMVDDRLSRFVRERSLLVGLAPGSVWNTKRWPAERFASLAGGLISHGASVILLGGASDSHLCASIASSVRSEHLIDLSGNLTLLQSAEAIRRCKVLVSNDSAPVHLGVAMRTPVVAIFGATSPAFGFAPRGQDDRIIETKGLPCRPCAIHGGDRCPISTFECMLEISPETVLNAVLAIASTKSLQHIEPAPPSEMS